MCPQYIISKQLGHLPGGKLYTAGMKGVQGVLGGNNCRYTGSETGEFGYNKSTMNSLY